MNILSIQSAVVSGHVGNSAATFPLQRLGDEVLAVPTVLFSNHPGHGSVGGRVLPAALVDELVGGLATLGALGGIDAVLSGYLGEVDTAAAVGRAVGEVRAANPAALYACDPVIGDVEPGVYVRPGLLERFRDHLLPMADLLFPNSFELSLLSGGPVVSVADAAGAAAALRARMRAGGPRIVVATSLRDPAAPPDTLELLLLTDAGGTRLRTPRLPMPFNGAGDVVAALFLHHFLRARDPVRALERAAAGVFGLIERTAAAGARELLLIEAQDEFVSPRHRFAAAPL